MVLGFIGGGWFSLQASGAAKVVFEPHDIVLAQIGSGLNFYQLKVDLSRIFQTMRGSHWDKGGFVLVQDLDLVSDRHTRGTPDNDPMFGPMVMHLQRQPLARLHGDTLDLVAVSEFE